MELGILSLSDLQTSLDIGQKMSAGQRIADTIDYVVLGEQLGLVVFALGEHPSLDFAVSSPAVVLAAIAARTERIRLTSAVTVLGVLDPVRVYQDFATVDLVSSGRAEIIAGHSAFTEPFALFGASVDDYDALYAERSTCCCGCAPTTTSLAREVPGHRCPTHRSRPEPSRASRPSGQTSAAHPAVPCAGTGRGHAIMSARPIDVLSFSPSAPDNAELRPVAVTLTAVQT